MNVVMLPSARDDLVDGFEFYEAQETGVGAYFLDCISKDVDGLQQTAGIHRKQHGCHKALSVVFPYAIYYTVEETHILVRAVLDCRRDPRWIARRMKKQP